MPLITPHVGSRLRVWILSQFYPPELGAPAIRLSRLARALVASGHDVSVLTSVPNYPLGVVPPGYRGKPFVSEMIDGVKVLRVWAYSSTSKSTIVRLLNQITFMIAAAIGGLFLKRPDVIFVESHPLFVVLAAGWLRRVCRAPIVLNVSDLWPESAVATGVLRADSLIVRVAERVERWAYRDAAHIVAMTEGIVAGVNQVHGRPERVTLIPNAVDLERFGPETAALRDPMRDQMGVGGRFTVVHVGNMSLTYDLDMVVDIAAEMRDVAFVFVGAGSQREHVERRVAGERLDNVRMMGTLPHSSMPAVWAAADLCIIAMKDSSLAGGTRPAKMFEALATGTPVVAAITGEGEELLRRSSAGIAVKPGAKAEMIAALNSYRTDAEARRAAADNGRAFAKVHFSPARANASYEAILLTASGRQVAHA